MRHLIRYISSLIVAFVRMPIDAFIVPARDLLRALTIYPLPQGQL